MPHSFWSIAVLAMLWVPPDLAQKDLLAVEQAFRLQLLRPDVTANDADDQALMRAQQIIGPPTPLLIRPDGKEHRAERIIDELSADGFLARLKQAGKG